MVSRLFVNNSLLSNGDRSAGRQVDRNNAQMILVYLSICLPADLIMMRHLRPPPRRAWRQRWTLAELVLERFLDMRGRPGRAVATQAGDFF